MALSESIVCSALGKLSIMLLERATPDEMRKEIQSVMKNLQDIQFIIKNLHRTGCKAHSGVETLIQDLAYGIEDATDIFVVGAGRDRSKRSIRSFIQRFAGFRSLRKALHNFSNEILSLNKVTSSFIPSIVSDQNEVVHERQFWWRPYAPDFDDFAGMEEDVERLVSFLIGNEKQHVQVISICGMGGTGKTTLACKLFWDSRVRRHFQCFAGVFVGQKFQTSRIWREILEQLEIEKRKEIDHVTDTELSYEVSFALKLKKCLIVLDDIWSVDDWKGLSAIFPFGQMASKIILTTRIREIAETMAGNKSFFHQMCSLTEEESWKLFARKAFPLNAQVNPEMEMIGREMVKRCGGVPLAIVMLGRHMRTKNTLMDWLMVHKNIEAYLLRGEDVGEAEIHHALGLSYDNLPYFLKPCFLYLGLFPADPDIEVEKLYLLWMAEGLVLSQRYVHEETSIDVADQYLGELVLQSLVEVEEEDVPIIRRFRSCRLNKLMHDLCLFKGKEENFLRVMDPGSYGRQGFGSDAARRVTICKHDYTGDPCKHHMAKHLRCLLLRGVSGHEQESVSPVDISNLMELKLLRTLDFDGFDFRQTALPKDIEKLVWLRYLSFKRCFLEELPSSIGKLSSLQILDLRVRSWIKMRVPNVLRKLKNLMHLFLPQCLCTLDGNKLQLDGLTLLETLANFNTVVCNVEDLLKLTQLRYLATTVEGSLEDLEGIIKRMHMTSNHILHSSLDIRNFDCYTEESQASFNQLLKCRSLFILHMQGKIVQIPPYQEISYCLMEIILDGSELEEDPMPILENLPSLRVLVLCNDAFLGENMVCLASGFSELKRLELSNLQFLKKWEIKGPAMPKLHTLTIEMCKELDMVPKGLKFVTTLRELKIIGMPQSFEDRLHQGGEDLHKVRHARIIFEKKQVVN